MPYFEKLFRTAVILKSPRFCDRRQTSLPGSPIFKMEMAADVDDRILPGAIIDTWEFVLVAFWTISVSKMQGHLCFYSQCFEIQM